MEEGERGKEDHSLLDVALKTLLVLFLGPDAGLASTVLLSYNCGP